MLNGTNDELNGMRTGRDKVIIIIGILTVSMLLFRCPEWLHSDRWYLAVAHHFFHANIFHLAANCLSLWLMFRNPSSVLSWSRVVTAFVLASLSWFASSADVIGASNFIFALAGLRTPSFSHAWWRQPSVRFFLIVTTAMAVLPQVSAITHISSFVLGCAVASASRFINTTSHDLYRVSDN